MKYVKTLLIFTVCVSDEVQAKSGDFTIFQQYLTAEIENDLTDGRWYYYKNEVKDGNGEQTLLVYNITFDEAKELCGKYRQPSFVFITYNSEELNFRLFSNSNRGKYSFRKIDERDGFNIRDKNADDLFSQIAKDFKINLPFKKLEITSDQMTESINKKNSGLRWSDYALLSCIEKSVNINIIGKYRYYARSTLWNN